MTAVELLPPGEAKPDNPLWHKMRREGISASEIAAVLGISKWDSPFSLYWRKVNGWDVETNDDMSTGTRCEPVIAEWWADQHPDMDVSPAGLYASSERPWQLATPDRLIHMACPCCSDGRCGCGLYGNCSECLNTGLDGPAYALLECKWTGSWDGWGDEGTDDIPVYYRAQILWQCDVLDVEVWHLAVLGPGGFRAYSGVRDERDLAVMREHGRRFMDRLESGEAPDVDGHTATIAALKRLHPSVEDIDVEVPVDLAEGYRRARALHKRTGAVVDQYESRVRAAIGGGRRAMCGDRLVASRSVFDRKPYEVGPSTVDRLNPGRAATYFN